MELVAFSCVGSCCQSASKPELLRASDGLVQSFSLIFGYCGLPPPLLWCALPFAIHGMYVAHPLSTVFSQVEQVLAVLCTLQVFLDEYQSIWHLTSHRTWSTRNLQHNFSSITEPYCTSEQWGAHSPPSDCIRVSASSPTEPLVPDVFGAARHSIMTRTQSPAVAAFATHTSGTAHTALALDCPSKNRIPGASTVTVACLVGGIDCMAARGWRWASFCWFCYKTQRAGR